MLPIVAQETMRPSQCGGCWMIPPRRTRRKYGNEMPRWAATWRVGTPKVYRKCMEMFSQTWIYHNLSRNTSKCQGSSSFSTWKITTVGVNSFAGLKVSQFVLTSAMHWISVASLSVDRWILQFSCGGFTNFLSGGPSIDHTKVKSDWWIIPSMAEIWPTIQQSSMLHFSMLRSITFHGDFRSFRFLFIIFGYRFSMTHSFFHIFPSKFMQILSNTPTISRKYPLVI